MLIGYAGIGYFWYREIQLFSFSVEIPSLPFSFDIVLITSAYFIFGHLLKTQLINFSPKSWMFVLSFAVFLAISLLTYAHIDLNKRVFEQPLYASIGTICGIYLVLSISYFIAKSQWLKQIR